MSRRSCPIVRAAAARSRPAAANRGTVPCGKPAASAGRGMATAQARGYRRAAWLLAPLLVTGEMKAALAFVSRYPAAAVDVATFAAVSAIGQHFIFYTIRNFSALACTTITTTRKFFTILASVVYYKHSLVPRQWAAVGLVFGAIVWEGVAKHQKKREAAAAVAVAAAAAGNRAVALADGKKSK